jgi:hypothetical protein
MTNMTGLRQTAENAAGPSKTAGSTHADDLAKKNFKKILRKP